ncbi:MAG: hypothetical protein ACTSQI_22385 [Candidatus Helarchaeota archaeon]
MERNNYLLGVITEKLDFDFIFNSESFQSCQCGYFSNNPRLKHGPRCGKTLWKTNCYFEVHLRPDTSILKDKVLRNFIDRVLIPFWEIGLIKCEKGFRIIDSADIWKGKVKSFEHGELIPSNPNLL